MHVHIHVHKTFLEALTRHLLHMYLPTHVSPQDPQRQEGRKEGREGGREGFRGGDIDHQLSIIAIVCMCCLGDGPWRDTCVACSQCVSV